MLNRGVPCCSVKSELGCLALLWDWRKLEEISCDYELNPAKRAPVVANSTSNMLKLIVQVSVHHTDLINDKDFCPLPSRLRLGVPSDLFDELWCRLFS
jgi:hypothetical protein